MSNRREKIRRAVQDGAEEQGVTLSEADEHYAVEFLDKLIPEGARVFDDLDDLLGEDTPQAKSLRAAVAAAVGPGKVDAALRAVVEELGFGQPTVNSLRDVGEGHPFIEVLAERLAALLEASGADR